MATAVIIALTLGYKNTVYQCFIHHLQEFTGIVDPITLYMSIYLLLSFRVINNVVYVTIVE